MMGRPGDLLGFPSWVADTLVDHVHLRYALLLVTLAWAALLARGRLLWALLPGVLFLDAVLGFWIASFGRPYGLLVDAETTRLAAETVAAALGGDEGPVSGEPLVLVPATLLARWGLPAGVVVALPTVLPLLVVPLIALVVSLLPRPRAEAALAGNLWLAFSTGQSEAIRGAGFLPGLWARPVAAVPGSFAARWNPGALDPVAFASREPLSTNLAATFRWIREHVPPHSTCVASPRYAPMVAVLGQRRVLRAPSLAEPADDQRRRRTERMLLAGREPDLRRRYQVGCLVFIDGDQGWLGIASPDHLSVVPGLALRYADEHARVYVVDR